MTIKINSQITLSHNLDKNLTKTNITRCNDDEYWARTFTLSDFGISTTEQFIIRSGQVAISNSYEGAIISFGVFAIDDNFPNSKIEQIGYGSYVEASEIEDIPEVIEIEFKNPIVVPSKIEKILVVVSQSDDIYNPNYKKVLIAGSENDNDKSWFKGCGDYSYTSTDNLTNPISDANYFINVTGEKLSTINSDSNVNLTHNIGDNPIQTNMFSCTAGYHYWARKFVLSDFGINENEEFIINKGFVGLSGAEWLSTVQFNIYKIDKNFPASFSEADLIGSSRIEEVPYFGYRYKGARTKIFLVDFKTPIKIPADVKTILIEVHKGIAYGDGEAFIAGTESNNDDSWYRGCNGDSSGEYRTTKQLHESGRAYWSEPFSFYITVNGEAKTILPFEITNDNNCVNLTNNFSLTNQSEIKSVKWDFDDTNSGSNNSSNLINTNHQFSTNGTYNVSAEVTHIDNTNYIITKEIEIFNAPNINSSVSLKQCENSDSNGFSAFNLNEAKAKIVVNPNNYIITFFEEKSLAESNSPNSIQNITIYTNKIVSNDIVWARVENTNGCFRISEINLTVSTTEIPSSFQKSLYECDSGTNTTDGVATFNFSSVTQEVKDLFPPNQQLLITYYENQADALAKENAISDISNHQNTNSPNQQTIYIRVENSLNNDCLGLGAHITLNVDTVPIANPVIINPECDNDRDGLFAFDTSNLQHTIIGNQTNVVVSYTDENGMVLPSPLPNPFSTASQTITARIENITAQDPNGQCYDETTINFIVNTVPLANTALPQEQCDDDTDGVFAFDTSNIESTILGNQNGLIVKYFDENNVALPSPLPNPFTTATQTIRVRLENPVYDTCYEETTIDFIVREKPNVSVIDEDVICMDNNPKLQIGVVNPNINYSYTWRDENKMIVGNAANTTISKGGTYTVIATSIYGCDSEEASITIRESSKSTINIYDINVQDDSDNNYIKINTSNLGFGNYEFRLLDSKSNVLIDYQENPYFENLDGGNYILEITDKDGCGSVSFEVSLISYPNYFTPNTDGQNDTWHIQGIGKSIYKAGTVRIYDRFGKTLKVLTINDTGWNGYYNGKKLPSNDYWFHAELITHRGRIITRKGNFSLISQ